MASDVPEIEPLYFQVDDLPYINYFYADEKVSCQVVLASPLPCLDGGTSDVHRLLFAWPAGNSGAAVFFKSPAGQDSLSLKSKEGRSGRVLDPVEHESSTHDHTAHPSRGVSGTLEISGTAILSLAILGSVRTIRDYTDGARILNPKVQESICFQKHDGTRRGIDISRLLFDGSTSIHMTFTALSDTTTESPVVSIDKGESGTEARLESGLYAFEAHQNYPQTPYMHPARVLKGSSLHHLQSLKANAVRSLSFLCNSEKLLAGGWRFFTYFGRDSMISLLLLLPILTEGQHGVIEVGLSAVLERINHDDGSVCHEEDIGDYPAAQAALNGTEDTDAAFDYKMIDTDFFLPILMNAYFNANSTTQSRCQSFLDKHATLIPSNRGMTYRQLLTRTCEKILDMAKPFAESDARDAFKNLISLGKGQPVGQWRDSNDGLGGGRYPYDVNTALMPAALRAISSLARMNAVEGKHGWIETSDGYAEVWESRAPPYFTSVIPHEEARQRLGKFKESGNFSGPTGADHIHEDLHLEAVALSEDGKPIEIMHTDTGFRLLLLPHLLHSPNPESISQHLSTLNSVADSILWTFPAGLFTRVGVLIANPAYSLDDSHHRTFTTGAYHGTVIWTWNSLALLARGIEIHLTAMRNAEEEEEEVEEEEVEEEEEEEEKEGSGRPLPAKSLNINRYENIRAKLERAYGKLWDCIQANEEHLSTEVWSWRWDGDAKGGGKGDFAYVPLSQVPTSDGAGQTESNAIQLWSLTFLSLERKRELET